MLKQHIGLLTKMSNGQTNTGARTVFIAFEIPCATNTITVILIVFAARRRWFATSESQLRRAYFRFGGNATFTGNFHNDSDGRRAA